MSESLGIKHYNDMGWEIAKSLGLEHVKKLVIILECNRIPIVKAWLNMPNTNGIEHILKKYTLVEK